MRLELADGKILNVSDIDSINWGKKKLKRFLKFQEEGCILLVVILLIFKGSYGEPVNISRKTP